MKKKHTKKSFSNEDIGALIKLLKVGLPLKDALNIITTKKNQKLVKEVIERLDHGETIETIFNYYLKEQIGNYFEVLINYLSFKDALALALKIYQNENTFKNQVLKELTYPVCLLVFTLVGIYLFNAYCFDGLLQSMNQFGMDFHNLILFKEILDILINCLMIGVLIFLILFIYMSRPKRLIMAYLLLNKYFPNSTYKEYLSSRFVLYFDACYKSGIKTKETIALLKAIKSQPLISFLAFHIDEELLKGELIEDALKSPYLDERLSRYIKIARYSDDLGEMLVVYYEDFKVRFAHKCRYLSKMIQISSYILIGVVIIFIYQILFIPMEIIGGF